MAMTMPPKRTIFLSYRRADSQEVVSRMFDRLSGDFGKGNVFRDIDGIGLGRKFRSVLEERLRDTAVGFVVIGPHWCAAKDANGQRRLDDPLDFVRLEVETLLSFDIPIIPVLVFHSTLPAPSELPSSLRPLLEYQATAVRPDPDFHRDMDRIKSHLQQIFAAPSPLSAEAVRPGVAAHESELLLPDDELLLPGDAPNTYCSECGQLSPYWIGNDPNCDHCGAAHNLDHDTTGQLLQCGHFTQFGIKFCDSCGEKAEPV